MSTIKVIFNCDMEKSNYQLCVKIIEARHLQQLANSMVVVKLGNKKKKTNVKEGTDCPVYNEVNIKTGYHLMKYPYRDTINIHSISFSILSGTSKHSFQRGSQ